ncbi:NAD(P)(+) transhydrogenase (Re/Si-specific) subunit beta [Synechococcus sp. Cruz-9H2]|uniref:NAD(P)(+) transhydrogenase (Re/Si-specific) subunit beta n=1 Tax=unclassified Synechococcus TaxID=2626047 RepID=UPI0020CB9FC3|nr:MULTISPECIES: NAD(P)(+) transhydrogenase (Re/Si-specific) subunit beta [unclassified Synechococcus]MCP9818466.1 NAD(P)(+) transhydrogenase (Re/Si-specific) subunit beta [Synechococcus sp. Cruz-9H2]MCP9842695.1 NAD(P)(+) transhydrogenase (Re/Si-specific) subunit beta [Synechococcus sp. Edmonson 11F2]MCP9855360.1 NAD(P)(+) transhydrogenase (Re/Si-specific) subunit beta [Synechococcus sp. Cruz-9C9]MCP9862393.1 NAD(P)(+) transhydrogenase (Re/Si-specific) subunit beta [Synechococcus sp. Cruz-7E5]
MVELSIELGSVLLLAFGLKGLAKIRTARTANGLAALAIGLAVVGLLLQQGLDGWPWMLLGLGIGGGLGAVLALRVAMTSMPETVALFNGCGGMSSLLVAIGAVQLPTPLNLVGQVSVLVSVLVGAITFSGSLVAMGKLQEWLGTPGWTLRPQRHAVNIMLAVACLVCCVLVLKGMAVTLIPLTVLSLLLGVGLTLPVGGADMPVVISLLNSYSGVAAAAAGFVVGSELLIVAGAMVGAAGLILTQVMCTAMNRSLTSVLFGGALGAGSSEAGDGAGGREEYTNVTSCSPEECALTLEAAERVIFVPGYGLAVAQAQHSLKELARLLEQHGIEVRYAIHPVAGRMPGHMNVLLAEADVPYDQLVEMDDINPDFPRTDVVIVLGANDVVNPRAKSDPASPLYGMPVLEVDQARTVFVVKRSLGSGYAGIRNDLFELPQTSMVFGDAKQVLQSLLQELRSLGVGKVAVGSGSAR